MPSHPVTQINFQSLECSRYQIFGISITKLGNSSESSSSNIGDSFLASPWLLFVLLLAPLQRAVLFLDAAERRPLDLVFGVGVFSGMSLFLLLAARFRFDSGAFPPAILSVGLGGRLGVGVLLPPELFRVFLLEHAGTLLLSFSFSTVSEVAAFKIPSFAVSSAPALSPCWSAVLDFLLFLDFTAGVSDFVGLATGMAGLPCKPAQEFEAVAAAHTFCCGGFSVSVSLASVDWDPDREPSFVSLFRFGTWLRDRLFFGGRVLALISALLDSVSLGGGRPSPFPFTGASGGAVSGTASLESPSWSVTSLSESLWPGDDSAEDVVTSLDDDVPDLEPSASFCSSSSRELSITESMSWCSWQTSLFSGTRKMLLSMCSWQKELGHSLHSFSAFFPQTSQWCQGQIQEPATHKQVLWQWSFLVNKSPARPLTKGYYVIFHNGNFTPKHRETGRTAKVLLGLAWRSFLFQATHSINCFSLQWCLALMPYTMTFAKGFLMINICNNSPIRSASVSLGKQKLSGSGQASHAHNRYQSLVQTLTKWGQKVKDPLCTSCYWGKATVFVCQTN